MKKILFILLLLPSAIFAQTLSLQSGVKIVNPQPLDYLYYESDNTPYDSEEEALAATEGLRYVGLKVNISGIDYVFTGTGDEDLEVYLAGKGSDFPGDSIKTYNTTYFEHSGTDVWFVEGIKYTDASKFGATFKLRFDLPWSDSPEQTSSYVPLAFYNDLEGGPGNTIINVDGTALPTEIDTSKTYLFVCSASGASHVPRPLLTEIKEGDVIAPNFIRTTWNDTEYVIIKTRDTSSISSVNGKWQFYDGRTNADSDFEYFIRDDQDVAFTETVTFSNADTPLIISPGASAGGQGLPAGMIANFEDNLYFTDSEETVHRLTRQVEDALTDGVTTSAPSQDQVFDALALKTTTALTASTGTAVAFDVPRLYGTDASPVTGNITYNGSGAITGQVQTMIHNDSSEPTFGSEFKVVGSYVPDVDNLIMFLCTGSGNVWVTISQENE